MQFAAIKLCKFAVIRKNLSIFAVINKNVAVITPLGDFDMRPIEQGLSTHVLRTCPALMVSHPGLKSG